MYHEKSLVVKSLLWIHFYVFTEPHLPNSSKFPWGENRLSEKKKKKKGISFYSGIHSESNNNNSSYIVLTKGQTLS